VALSTETPKGLDAVDLTLYLPIFVMLYFVPTAVAWSRNHPNAGMIAVINVFLGWTGVAWVIALAMAVAPRSQQVIIINNTLPPSLRYDADQHEILMNQLHELREDGYLSQVQYEVKCQQLLMMARSESTH